ncbi:MAG: signal peptidase [Chthoniobacter sp.]|nr:signal peptidase [Chthoniobacter sp.]
MKLLLALALPLYALDQATKWWVVTHLDFGSQQPVVPGFFDLVYFGNTGAAFSMFRNNNLFFVVLSLVTLVALLIATARDAFRDLPSRCGVGLLVAGILGNVTDRLIHHHVVDFLLFDLHVPFANPWPAFNVADSCICVAVGLFIVATLRGEPKETKVA